MEPNDHYLCFCSCFFFFAPIAHMWFDNKIFEADTTEDQSGSPMEKVLKKITCIYLLQSGKQLFQSNAFNCRLIPGIHWLKLQACVIVLSLRGAKRVSLFSKGENLMSNVCQTRQSKRVVSIAVCIVIAPQIINFHCFTYLPLERQYDHIFYFPSECQDNCIFAFPSVCQYGVYFTFLQYITMTVNILRSFCSVHQYDQP